MTSTTRFLAIFLFSILLSGGCGSTPVMKPSALRPATTQALNPSTVPATRAADAFPVTTDPRDTLPFLASDELAGRLPGSPGIKKAGDFLAAELARIGLQRLPGRTDYFQPFDMAQTAVISSSTSLLINGQAELLRKDFVPMALSAEKAYRGPVVFVGFGITTDATESVHYDDYAGIDVHGKVVLALTKEPLDSKGVSRISGTASPWSNHALFVEKAKNAADHGAVALLLVVPPSSGGPDNVSPANGDSRRPSPIPVIQISRRMANVILSIGGMTDLKSIQDQIYTSFTPQSSPLKDVDADGTVIIDHSKIAVRNVLAYLPGTGPHANEWVVVGAHYDHLGLGQMGHMMGGTRGSIWHGADDNASGTAALLELADRMKKAPPPPRSVLFIFFTAEEEGLVGSDYFVNHPLILLDRVVAMLNLDMVGRLRSQSLEIGGAGTAPNLDAIVQSAIAGTKLITSVALADDGGRGGMGPSDHMSFAQHKIPVLFLFTGMHSDYHRPTDTADKINYDGIDELVGVSQRIVAEMATMPRQQYNSSFDNTAMGRMMPGGGRRPMLGVVPDDNAMEATNGVPISGVVTGGAAEKAGFKSGDLLIAFNGKTLKTLGDLSAALDAAHAGDSVVVKVLRGSKAVELNAVLR